MIGGSVHGWAPGEDIHGPSRPRSLTRYTFFLSMPQLDFVRVSACLPIWTSVLMLVYGEVHFFHSTLDQSVKVLPSSPFPLEVNGLMTTAGKTMSTPLLPFPPPRTSTHQLKKRKNHARTDISLRLLMCPAISDRSEKTVALRRRCGQLPPTAKQEKDEMCGRSLCDILKKNVLSAEMLEVSLLGVERVLCIGKGSWSML